MLNTKEIQFRLNFNPFKYIKAKSLEESKKSKVQADYT